MINAGIAIGLIIWASVILSAGIGAKIGSDLHDAMKCNCSSGWVTIP